MVQQIVLTLGKYALVDDEDYAFLNQHKWHAHRGPADKTFYAIRSVYKPSRKGILMHRVVMQCPREKQIDHINHDGLDNRKQNLRIVSHSENQQNRRGSTINNISGIRGIAWHTYNNKWYARITVNGKRKNLGYFIDKIEAAEVVQKARRELMPFSEMDKVN